MENPYEKIEGYLLGELTEHEQTAFEHALQTDAALSRSVAQHREMMQRLEALRLRKKVEWAREADRAKPMGKRIALSLAVLLVLLAAAIWFLNQPSQTTPEIKENPSPAVKPENFAGQQPMAQNETPAPKPNTPQLPKANEKSARHLALAREYHIQPTQTFVRDAVGASDASLFRLAAEAYQNKKYRLALDLLQQRALKVQDEEAVFLRAHTHFQLRQFVSAAKDFEVLKNSFQYQHEARWNFLLCQIAMGKMEQAKKLLSQMAAAEDFPFHANAIELKRKLYGQ